jgi:hypothetical protein
MLFQFYNYKKLTPLLFPSMYFSPELLFSYPFRAALYGPLLELSWCVVPLLEGQTRENALSGFD